jgi:predicted amidohydrolase YtcJ
MRFKAAVPGVAATLAAAVLHAAPAPAPADLVLDGAAVYTLDAARSWAEAVAVRDGRIVFVGTRAGARAFVGPKTRVLKLDGRMLLPGFQDAHAHPISGGLELALCNLNDIPTADAVLAKVRECAKDMAARPWISGGGWLLPVFPGGNPRKEDLDAIVPDKPVSLSAADGHSSWVNSKALALAGITKDTPDPKDGRIERDPKSGEPTGTLRESASDLVSRHMPAASLEDRVAGLLRAQELFAAAGVTAVQEASAGGGAEGAGARPTLEAYREAERRGQLTLRVVANLTADPARGPEQVADMAKLRSAFASGRLRPVYAKIFADGVIEPRTAAMLEPYTDRPGDRGEPIFAPEALNALVARLAAERFGVHVHAIGDRAVRITLDAFEAARRTPENADLRFQITHLEVIDPADVPRFRRHHVIANFQALWAYADDYIVDMTWGGLGPERSRWIYPIGSVVHAGGPLALGSDWSVSSLKPLDAIQVALTRQGLTEPRRPAMVPEEAIDLPTALAGYTIGSAYANGLEKDTGSIEVGKAADLVVIERNLFEVSPFEIAQQRVLLTLLDGKPVHRDPELAW